MHCAPLRVLVDSTLRTGAVPRIAVAAFEREFADVVVDRLVAVAEDGFAGGEAVITRPDLRCSRGGDEVAALGACACPHLSGYGCTPKPLDAGFAGGLNGCAGIGQRHKVEQDVGAFATR